MAVNAGAILTIGSRNVIDRLQSAGLGDNNTTFTTIREVGNYEVVDKIPEDPEFTFTMEGMDVSTDVMATLVGKLGTDPLASASAPGASDPDGTMYKWTDTKAINITSPWKAEASANKFVIAAGYIIPGYFPTRISYSFSVTDSATQNVEISGGSFYYGAHSPYEDYFTGNGSTTTFTSTQPVVQHRKGGPASSTFQYVWGVLVNNVVQSEGVDYSVSGSDGSTATVTFNSAPANGAVVRFCYFSRTPLEFPQSVHASTLVKPGTVRGRDIDVYIDKGLPTEAKLGNIQALTLEGTTDSEIEREFGNADAVGRTINGRDVTGSMTSRSRDVAAFTTLLSAVTGVDPDEVFGYLNQKGVTLDVEIRNPNTGNVIKTLYVQDAIFTVPGAPARVNSPTDFALNWQSRNGDFAEVKGQRVP